MRRSSSPTKGRGVGGGGGGASSSKFLGTSPASGARAAFKPLTIAKTTASEATDAAKTRIDPQTVPDQQRTAAVRSRQKSIEELKEEIADLEILVGNKLKAHNELRKARGQPEQDAKAIVSNYIELLHEYNQVKDTAQIIFDKIAEIEQIPSRAVYERYGLTESD